VSRVGEVLDGKYEIERLLGEGGMGEVYVARHKHIGKDVAIKFLRRDLTSDDDAVTRFAREARAAAAVGHRGIVDIYDVGACSDGSPYLVMELLDGASLRTVLEGHAPLTVGQTAAIVSELLSALAAAHDKGVVHRDLKPDNVFIERSDGPLSVKLLDFGIAKMAEGAGLRVTQTGRPMGTAPYMSPEQARGARDLDARVDVYAVGVMLYESLAGRLPFDADNYNAMIVQILTEPAPALRTLRPDLPVEIDELVMRALAKDARQRFQTAEELLSALRPHADHAAARRLVPAVKRSSPELATAPTIRGTEVPVVSAAERLTRTGALAARRRWFRSLAVVALAVLGLSTAWRLSRTEPRPATPSPASRASREPPPPVRPAIVTITVEGAPRGARVVFDGALVTELPIRIAPRATMAPLRVEADGFAPQTQMVLPTRDRRVRVSLVATPPERPAEPPVAARRKGTAHARPPAAESSSSPIDHDTTEFDE
jgi:serine/threonine-protein kinase